MEKETCGSCGCQNDEHAYFCSECGRFLLSADFGGTEEAAFKLKRIADNLKLNPHTEIFWDDTVDAYTQKVERIESLLRVGDLGGEKEELNRKVASFLKMCRNPDFEIAFVGAVKAGKSTLINALLGKNYAATDPNPETAVLTKFRSSDQDYVRVKFYSEQEWERLWNSVQKDAEKFLRLYEGLNAGACKDKWVGHMDLDRRLGNSEIEAELEQWTSSRSPAHFFVREIEVGISTLPKDFPKQVVFVDTPGLFDPVAFRSQISIDYIRSANAVLVCVKADSLHGEEVKVAESVFSFSGHKRDKVFLVATNWDKLNNVVEDWEKRSSYMIDTFSEKAFFTTRELAKSNIMYADSYHYNLCRDYRSLTTYEQEELEDLMRKISRNARQTLEKGMEIPKSIEAFGDRQRGDFSPSDLKKLMEATNIRNINKMIFEHLVSQYSKLLFADIKNLYGDIRHLAARVAGERRKTLGERITISNADFKKVEEKIAETKRNQEEIHQCQQQLTAALGSLEKNMQKRLEQILSQLEQLAGAIE